MAQAKDGDKVKVHYTGKLDDGKVFDSSKEKEPLEFTLGEGSVIQGLEDSLSGMEEGESKTTTISSDKAYGPYRDDMIIEVDKEKLPENLEPEEGQVLQAKQENGAVVNLTIKDIKDATVVLDGNHPLAGKDLTFDIKLVDINK